MEWTGKSESLNKLAELRAKKGLSTPAIDDRPEIYEDLIEAWQAFQELNQSRQVGLSANPILVSEIKAWLELHNINDLDERLELHKLIRILDQTWLSWVQAKQAEKEK